MNTEPIDHDGDVVLGKEQSAVFFDDDGSMTLYIPRRSDDAEVTDGNMQLARVMVLMSDKPVSALVRKIIDAYLDAAMSSDEEEPPEEKAA
jgi:hypothetical protein